VSCKLGFDIDWSVNILDRPCHVRAETDCDEKILCRRDFIDAEGEPYLLEED
jgi:hypothetical protein